MVRTRKWRQVTEEYSTQQSTVRVSSHNAVYDDANKVAVVEVDLKATQGVPVYRNADETRFDMWDAKRWCAPRPTR